ncbi:HAD family hydrolase [Candidatus Woesearchaeota archaeon]|nr:HAD family hydrolase [Candidatus Woesearchaeota archaeon]
MAGADAMQPEGLGGAMLDVLLLAQPLTARQIYYKVRSRCGISVSYQAVHKKLQHMREQGQLRKDRLEYSIDEDWLGEMESFVASARGRLKERDRMLHELERRKPLFRSRRIKVLCLDMDDTLFDTQFDELLWRREFPNAYAKQYRVTKEKAFSIVTGEYRRLWGKVRAWRDPDFWIKHFRLKTTFETLICGLRKDITLYPDVQPTLERLSRRYHLVLLTHAERKMLDIKLSAGKMQKRFLRVYSVSSDFRKMVITPAVCRELCEELGVLPEEVCHLGDDAERDYAVPTAAGMHAFLIDRRGYRKEPHVVRDLYEFEEKLSELER